MNIGDAISTCLDALEETGIDEDSGELNALWVESFDIEGDLDGESDDDTSTSRTILRQVTTDTCELYLSFCEEYIAKLFRSEYTWTGFLQDSEESLTIAIVGMTCLDFIHQNGYGRRCTA